MQHESNHQLVIHCKKRKFNKIIDSVCDDMTQQKLIEKYVDVESQTIYFPARTNVWRFVHDLSIIHEDIEFEYYYDLSQLPLVFVSGNLKNIEKWLIELSDYHS